MHSEDIQEIVREKIWQKTQVVGFHFLPGRSAGGPGKGKLLFYGQGFWRLALAAERGAAGEKTAAR
uniref:Macaca fascicularis brain cDNA clone: QflA-20724, similar to human solute carrier family 31 (copper transporters), member 1(SLC31A1), mRNA, RefSeq: NM_001859.2 n=1 Tax=Macaca fascicularis TaxID=9541 RepID=I7G6N0_MACFA|nr:unnamed protein product [Macaca fascicularis]